MSDVDDALAIVHEVFNLGIKWNSLTDAQLVDLLERTSPHRSVDWLVGAKNELANKAILNLIWTVAGDAYVSLNRPVNAASAFRTALSYHTNACFSDTYAKIVIQNCLFGHYEPARSAMERSLVAMNKYNLRFRLLCHWISLRKSPRGYFRFVMDNIKRASRLRELDRRLRAMATDTNSK